MLPVQHGVGRSPCRRKNGHHIDRESRIANRDSSRQRATKRAHLALFSSNLCPAAALIPKVKSTANSLGSRHHLWPQNESAESSIATREFRFSVLQFMHVYVVVVLACRLLSFSLSVSQYRLLAAYCSCAGARTGNKPGTKDCVVSEQ